jgi:hypothetical protein
VVKGGLELVGGRGEAQHAFGDSYAVVDGAGLDAFDDVGDDLRRRLQPARG